MHWIGHLLTILILQPLFNLLVFITAILPGHDFGLAIIIFTVLVRIAMWPLVKKQLHQTRAMQKLQPDLKRLKQAAGGDRQKESKLLMELYKEKGINPFASLGIVILQLPIFIALYLGVRKIIYTPNSIVSFSYSWLHHLSWIKSVSLNIGNFHSNLFGLVDLTRHALGSGLYWPAVLIAAAAALAQFYQSKQLMPQSTESRSLKSILGDASAGKTADQAELNAAVGRSTIFLIPVMVFVFGLSFPAALPLYWFVNSGVATFQQAKVLSGDEQELETQADATAVEPSKLPAKKAKAKHSNRRSRRKRR